MVMGLRSVVLMELMILLNVILAVKATAAAADQAQPGCQSHCGDVSIRYPFGTGGDCNITRNFFIRCNTSFIPPKPFYGKIEVLDISLDGQLRILTPATYDCYNSSGRSAYLRRSFRLAKFLINNTRNKFTAIGCDTYALVQSSLQGRYATGFLSICNNIRDVINGSCSGIGCCQTPIPKGVRGYSISLASYANHSDVLPENPCSYAFVAEDGAYSFSNSDLRGYGFQDKEFPVTLDWTIGNISCNEARKDTKNFACKENTTRKCTFSDRENGH